MKMIAALYACFFVVFLTAPNGVKWWFLLATVMISCYLLANATKDDKTVSAFDWIAKHLGTVIAAVVITLVLLLPVACVSKAFKSGEVIHGGDDCHFSVRGNLVCEE